MFRIEGGTVSISAKANSIGLQPVKLSWILVVNSTLQSRICDVAHISTIQFDRAIQYACIGRRMQWDVIKQNRNYAAMVYLVYVDAHAFFLSWAVL